MTVNTETDKVSVFAACILAFLSLSELVHQYFQWPLASALGGAALLLLGLSLAGSFRLREWALVLVAAGLSAGLLVSDRGSGAIWSALEKASFFAAFIYLVTLLKEAAQRSPSVLDLGQYLTRQTRGRRYYSLAIGGHGLGVLLNFGAISLLTPLIQRGARASSADPGQIAIAEQQQISALLRGFSWMIMWSPTALTQAVLFTAFPSVNLMAVIGLGIAASIIMILLGRLEDRLRRRPVAVDDLRVPPEFPTRSAVRFLSICCVLIMATYLVVWLTEVSGAVALMLVAPVTMVAWLFSQIEAGNLVSRLVQTDRTTRTILIESAPSLGRSALILGAAGFIGGAAASLTPTALVAETLQIGEMPEWLFLCLLPIIINLCGQIALSPILVVVFLSAVLNSLPELPADPTLIVFALGAGWAMSMSASPNASATLLISSITNIAPTTLTWRWNGVYSLMCYVVFALSFYLLSVLT
jgi:hypothetical protein